MDIACKHKEMRRLHIEMGTAAHLRGDFDAAAGHMRLALYYNMELSSIIEDSYARLFCSPAGGHVIRLCASKTQDSFEYILSCKDLALKVVIDELFKAVPSDCITSKKKTNNNNLIIT